MSHSEVYDAVRYVLWRWGKIAVFRVDNGSPFGDPSRQSFSVLHLCLVAHGIHLKINPPRTPTRNAKVERNQGTTARWSEPSKCENYLELQDKLNQAVIDQREHYPTRVCQNQTRIEAYPELKKNPARFNVADFDLGRVYTFLTKGRWIRTVSDRGSIILFKHYYQLTNKNKGRKVTARFNKETVHWDFFDQYGVFLKTLPVQGLSMWHLINGIRKC